MRPPLDRDMRPLIEGGMRPPYNRGTPVNFDPKRPQTEVD